VDTWVAAGTEVTAHYDPMLAKLIVHGDTREQALAKLRRALADTRIAGLESNLDYLRAVTNFVPFVEGQHTTRSLGSFTAPSTSIEVLAPGVQTTVQDWPGRQGYWDVGVPPSGPMDDLSFRLANRLVGNDDDAAGLELTLSGPTLRFHHASRFALCGAAMTLTLDGRAIEPWQVHAVEAGSVLRIGSVAAGGGSRCYLAVRGGLDVPAYLGSRATFTLGQFGGHAGRTLRTGDMLHLGDEPPMPPAAALAIDAMPRYAGDGHEWDIAVLYGPHGAPDFFTDADIATFFATPWQVHYNSSRTGVRLIGPKPEWARRDGGEAGLHPSIFHD